MAPKNKKDRDLIKLAEMMRKDAEEDSLLNPKSWDNVGQWAAMYDYSHKEVVELILNDARRNDKLKYKNEHFEVCIAIERFRQGYNKFFKRKIKSGEKEECSVNKAILGSDKTLRKILGTRYTVEQADGIHRRIVKKNKRRWNDFLNHYYAHLDN